jgi:uncharacterized lipoprotein YddW (UPF0748 family)
VSSCRFVLAALLAITTPLHPGGAFAFQRSPASTYLTRLARTTPVQPANEVRALWVVRDALRSVAAVDRMIDFAIQTRFHLLFVQVRGRGETYYRSSIEPPARDLELPLDDFDPLEYLLIRARRAGISVHAWVNVFYVWSDPNADPPEGHVVSRHPDWLLSSPDGVRQDARGVRWWQQDGIEGYYLSPARPEVRAYTASVVRELVSRYAVDGVHLDYVRYPGLGYTYGADARTEFALRWGIDPLELGKSAGLLREDFTSTLDSIYVDARVAGVDSAVAAIRAVTGELPLSAAVVANDVVARAEKAQDWVGWLRRGLVDFVAPMAYADTPQELERRLRYFHRVVGRDRLLIGVGVYDGRDRFLAETVPLIRGAGASGFALFSYNALAENPFSAAFLEEAILSTLPEEPGETTGDDEEREP